MKTSFVFPLRVGLSGLAGLGLVLASALVTPAKAQGVYFQDANQPAYDTTLAGAVNITQDLNLELLEGPDAVTLNSVIATLLISDMSATGDITIFGYIYDSSSTIYSVPAGTDYFQVLAWTGSASSYASAVASGTTGVYAGSSPVFSQTIPAVSDSAPALNLPGIINLTQVPPVVTPEPSLAAATATGLAAMLVMISRRRK